jgi:hypothetical protein
MSRGTSTLDVNEKYRLYESSVQCAESDVEFLHEEYERYYGRKPVTVREDFGGTGSFSCDWVKQSDENEAWAVDLDSEPIRYGKENHFSKLNDEQQKRMHYIEGNVLDEYEFKTDIVVAFNFSYFIFKKRAVLLDYFKKVRASLKPDGAFFLDLFGGSDAREAMVEETEHEDHTYFWDCDQYNPLTHECLYYIHFKTHKDNKKHNKVFVYDWRMWGPAELRDILEEAGFSDVYLYWEGEDEDGDGDGNFFITEEAENCESWVTYIGAKA